MTDTITRVPGIQVGHWTNEAAATGCTVVLTPQGATAGVAVYGAAPGSRELTLLAPGRLVEKAHAVLITGGSAFGLAAADGVMQWLEERGFGMAVGNARVPIVPAAVLLDLGIGDPGTRPGAAEGYAACEAASTDPVPMGNVGAGTGATVGKILGAANAMKGGLGSAFSTLDDGTAVGALVAVNALGDVVDPSSGRIVAGARDPGTDRFVGTLNVLRQGRAGNPLLGANTTLGIVATDGAFSKGELAVIAGMAHNGLARSIFPVHTLYDGDTMFALSTGTRPSDPTAVGALAATLITQAVLRAVRAAETLFGIPSSASRGPSDTNRR